MKKIYTLLASLLLVGSFSSKAQDTLLYESFNFQNFYDVYLIKTALPPPGVNVDSLWYSYDADGLADGSPSGTREGGWFAVQPFASIDTTNNVALASSSWFSPAAAADNWLITPNIQLGEHDTLFWKSAPVQTPRYLDGYEVKLSTTTNDDLAFNTLLFTAAEMTQVSAVPGDSAIFANHTFSTPGFIHGLDSTFIEVDTTQPTGAFRGILRPFSVALDAYANQNVFIGIHHNSFDDNLISIDDVMIRGTVSNPVAGIKENKMDLNLNLFPNPANDNTQLNFELSSESSVIITIYDITGKSVYSENKGSMARGRHFAFINTAELTNGFYTIAVQTKNGKSLAKIIVQ